MYRWFWKCGRLFLLRKNYFMGHLEGYFEGAKTFCPPFCLPTFPFAHLSIFPPFYLPRSLYLPSRYLPTFILPTFLFAHLSICPLSICPPFYLPTFLFAHLSICPPFYLPTFLPDICWARICKLLRSQESIPPAYVAGTTTLFIVPARQAT